MSRGWGCHAALGVLENWVCGRLNLQRACAGRGGQFEGPGGWLTQGLHDHAGNHFFQDFTVGVQGRVGVHFQQPHLEIFIDQEVTADEVKVAQLALQLGFDGQEAVGHDLLHPLREGGEDPVSREAPGLVELVVDVTVEVLHAPHRVLLEQHIQGTFLLHELVG